MARLRYNGLRAALAGSGLTNSGTTITFAAGLTHSNGTNVPTLSGSDYIPLAILDSSGYLSEIVHLTAYTAGGTTGTIVRGREGTSGVTHSSGDAVVGSPLKDDVLGLLSSPPPTTPGAYDDEFDGLSGVTWTATPTAANTFDINTTARHHAYIKASGSGAALVGKHQPVPGAYPYTITAKVSSTARANYHRGGGIFVAPASPTGTSNIAYLGVLYHTSYGNRSVQRVLQSFAGSSVSNTSQGNANTDWGPMYLKMVVNSATSIDTYVSRDGMAWFPVESGFNPGFTPGVMGICCNEESAGGGVEAYFDFFRVT